MYKVFVVDDEIVVREGLRENVEWDKSNLLFAGEAQDGEMALPLIQEIKPDILLTDIKMPFMDGLELSRIIRKSMPWIKIIILSGHDEFNYAKEAISIGVAEYILKPFTSREILDIIGKVVEEIEEEKKRSQDIVALKEQLKKSKPLLCNQFLNDLLLGLVSPYEILDKCASFEIDILAKYYITASIHIACKASTAPSEYSEYMKTDTVISNTVRMDKDVIPVKRNLEETVLILKGNESGQLEEAVYRTAQSIQYEVERNTNCTITIGIGSLCGRLQEIAKSYTDACTARDFKHAYGKNSIIGINDMSTGIYEDISASIDKPDIVNLLKYGTKSDIPRILSEYIKGFNEADLRSAVFSYYVFMNVVVCCGKYINETGGEISTVLPMLSQPDKSYMKMESIRQLENELREVLEQVLDYRDRRVDSRQNTMVTRAKEYINANFSDTQISLNTVAAQVNISPSHFSTLFSQATGETFIEYLISLRIKKAMSLLKTTGLRSSEIAYEVGYNDPHYFSFCFKKETGKTPSEYRQENNPTT